MLVSEGKQGIREFNPVGFNLQEVLKISLQALRGVGRGEACGLDPREVQG
jgi:hypothetical protein